LQLATTKKKPTMMESYRVKRSPEPQLNATTDHILPNSGAHSPGNFAHKSLRPPIDKGSHRFFYYSFFLRNTMTMMINATPSGHGGRTSYERGSAIVALSSSSFTNDKLATLPFLQDTHEPRQLTLQTAKEIVSSADIIEQALKESGRSYDRNLPMVWAMGNHTTSREISARIQAEKRGYIYDGFQKGIDREISQQQHQESISTMKEEAGWMSQLVAARDRCFGSISTAIVRGIILVAFIKLLPFLYGVLKEGASFTAVAGEILGTVCLEYVHCFHLVNYTCIHTNTFVCFIIPEYRSVRAPTTASAILQAPRTHGWLIPGRMPGHTFSPSSHKAGVSHSARYSAESRSLHLPAFYSALAFSRDS
jgi:hypothetical protein